MTKSLLTDAVIRAVADGCARIAIVCSGGPDHWPLRRALSDSFGAVKGERQMEMVAHGIMFRFVPWGEKQADSFCRVLVHDAHDQAAVEWVRKNVAKGCPVEEVF